MILREALAVGLDPKVLYAQAVAARPKEWPPAPSYDVVMPPSDASPAKDALHSLLSRQLPMDLPMDQLGTASEDIGGDAPRFLEDHGLDLNMLALMTDAEAKEYLQLLLSVFHPQLPSITWLRHASRSAGAHRRVTRQEAQHIAAAHLAHVPEFEGARVRDVYAWSEIRWRRPVFFDAPAGIKDSWVAYLEFPNEPPMLRSSRIVVVSQTTGRVLYAGDAGDEG